MSVIHFYNLIWSTFFTLKRKRRSAFCLPFFQIIFNFICEESTLFIFFPLGLNSLFTFVFHSYKIFYRFSTTNTFPMVFSVENDMNGILFKLTYTWCFFSFLFCFVWTVLKLKIHFILQKQRTKEICKKKCFFVEQNVVRFRHIKQFWNTEWNWDRILHWQMKCNTEKSIDSRIRNTACLYVIRLSPCVCMWEYLQIPNNNMYSIGIAYVCDIWIDESNYTYFFFSSLLFSFLSVCLSVCMWWRMVKLLMGCFEFWPFRCWTTDFAACIRFDLPKRKWYVTFFSYWTKWIVYYRIQWINWRHYSYPQSVNESSFAVMKYIKYWLA